MKNVRYLNRALAILVIGLGTLAAHGADSGRTFVAPPGSDPKTAPPYNNGVMVGGTFYVSGHLGVDPATGKVASDPEAEARLVMDAVKQTLEKGGLTMADLVSVTVYCTDLDLYDKFNAVYRSYFHDNYPARAFIGVAKLVRGARFEIAGVAVKASGRR
ncbi:MAG TPA: Rid family hydrolase [Steroidobacteraceae bacterium]|jgi:2-iminobutanoate/2-iminopropanoate deaminase|nr:Rid family hydrolase [Steroidobacteraceae bacterium]